MKVAQKPLRSITSKGKAVKERLAKSAFVLFSENPIADVTLDMVAEKAAVTKGSLYCHYRSKKELILEACRVYYQRWERLVVDYASVDQDSISRLRKAVLSSAEMCLFDHRNRFFTAQVFALAIKDAAVKESWTGFYRRVHSFFQHLLNEAAASGAAKIANPKAAADRMLSILEGAKQQAFFDAEFGAASQIGIVVEAVMKTALES
jgi:AcrR family transcriptional regulator